MLDDTFHFIGRETGADILDGWAVTGGPLCEFGYPDRSFYVALYILTPEGAAAIMDAHSVDAAAAHLHVTDGRTEAFAYERSIDAIVRFASLYESHREANPGPNLADD